MTYRALATTTLALTRIPCRLRPEQPIRRAAAAEGHRCLAGRPGRHALFRRHRKRGRGQFGRSRRPRAGFCPGHQLYRRPIRQERHVAVHHRARALPAQSRCRQGGRHQRTSDADAGAGRVPAPGRSDSEAGLDPSQLRQGAGATRFGAGRPAIGAGQRASRPRSISAIPTSPRRSTASSPPVRCRSANWSAPTRRPCSPPSCSSIRSG